MSEDRDMRGVNWQNWMLRWDKQQGGYMPLREERFKVMLDILEAELQSDFVAIDLACGPGSISQRLLRRFPQARSIALDLDPVLLTLGQHVLGDMQGRLRWIEADLRDPAWLNGLGVQQVDAVLSTTALHWLSPDVLVRVYQQLAGLIRPGGLFFDGDHFAFDPQLPTFRKITELVRTRIEAEAFAGTDVEDWKTWWEAFAREPVMKEFFEERERRLVRHQSEWPEPTLMLHEAALRCAGFSEVGIIWRGIDDCLLMAVR